MRSLYFVSWFVVASAVALSSRPVAAALPGGTQDPNTIPKYQVPLVIPPAMPRTDKIRVKGGKNIEYYEIAVRQFEQQILPPGMPETTVWSYGSVNHPWTFNYPAFTIEAKHDKPVRIKWINDLVDADGNFLPHLFPIDQTLHWANPLGQCADGMHASDCRGFDPTPYTGPVPLITHVHGAHSRPQYDGFPEAWYLPDAADITDTMFEQGSAYAYFEALAGADGLDWGPGYVVFEYANDQDAATLWYHDHTLGMTRVNVYAGPAGFYILRGGDADISADGILPGPAPALDDLPGIRYHEIPIAIQDRSFNSDGSLFYPDHRAFFEGLDPFQLQIPFIPEFVQGGLDRSDVPKIWNPEFFGNTIVVNGRTWPHLEVEPRRYRFRLLNGSQSRFLILANDNDLPMWQIGSDGGFLPEPVELLELLLGPAERADVIVDFGELPVGTTVTLLNLGPDAPFGGGEPGIDFEPSDPETTGQVMQFRVVAPEGSQPDQTADPALGELILPMTTPLEEPDEVYVHRALSLAERESETVLVTLDQDGNVVEDPDGEPFGPVAALLGTWDPLTHESHPLEWEEPLTENPGLGETEIWEIHNVTEDAHPIHLHQVQFQVLNREVLFGTGDLLPPEWWEEGFKDTVIAYPGQITRIKAHFDLPGLYVWHCHILEHEDNEMMRPFHVGAIPDDLPVPF
jgi:spore coat protein A